MTQNNPIVEWNNMRFVCWAPNDGQIKISFFSYVGDQRTRIHMGDEQGTIECRNSRQMMHDSAFVVSEIAKRIKGEDAIEFFQERYAKHIAKITQIGRSDRMGAEVS